MVLYLSNTIEVLCHNIVTDPHPLLVLSFYYYFILLPPSSFDRYSHDHITVHANMVYEPPELTCVNEEQGSLLFALHHCFKFDFIELAVLHVYLVD